MPKVPRKRWKKPTAATDPLAPLITVLAQLTIDDYIDEQIHADEERNDEPD